MSNQVQFDNLRYVSPQLETRYGPNALIGRALISIERALHRRGVRISFEPIDRLLDINKQKSDWLPLVPMFDGTFNDLDKTNSFAIFGRDPTGEVVATQAARLYEWPTTTFTAEAEALRLHYAQPELYRRPGETCEVTAKAGRAITGRFVFSGAAWNAPEMRRKGIVQLLARYSRAYALTLWNADVVGTMMAASTVRRGVSSRVNYSGSEWGVKMRNSRVGNLNLCLFWITPDEITADLTQLLRVLDVDISAAELDVPHHSQN